MFKTGTTQKNWKRIKTIRGFLQPVEETTIESENLSQPSL
jgi:hypothetical protein